MLSVCGYWLKDNLHKRLDRIVDTLEKDKQNTNGDKNKYDVLVRIIKMYKGN